MLYNIVVMVATSDVISFEDIQFKFGNPCAISNGWHVISNPSNSLLSISTRICISIILSVGPFLICCTATAVCSQTI